MNHPPLSADQIQQALLNLPGWSVHNDSLVCTFKFANFRKAVAFIVQVAFEAEQLNHHPELHNVYSTVTLKLNTHDAGGKVTQLDVDLARAISRTQ
jgi:4a-hydroxytetrahydrobiopterin dehydratase